MEMRTLVLIAGGLFATATMAEPGEKGGAYGGDTTGEAATFSFQEADNNGDGVVSEEEARRVGIERFDAVDKNQDGELDEAEIAALEESTRDAEAGSDNQGDGEESKPQP